MTKTPKSAFTRRGLLKSIGAGAGVAAASSFVPDVARFAHAQSAGPIKVGFTLED